MTLIKNEWIETKKFFEKKIRKIFLISFGAFILIGIGTALILSQNPHITEMLFNQISAMFETKGLLEQQGMGLAWGLLFNNIQAMGFSILLGFIPFLFIPCLSLFTNAYIIGMMFASFQIKGISSAAFFLGILPHGILEIPVFVLGVALGIYICKTMIKLIVRSAYSGEFKEAILGCLRIFILWMVPLTLIAAFIESFITPMFLSLIL